MKTKIKKTMFFALMMATGMLFNVASAQSENEVLHKTTISVETDPSTFMFGGYALHLRIKPANNQHLVLGVGTYAMSMPDLFIGKENSDNGWKVKISSAFGIFGEYYFSEANTKWFAGLQSSIQNYSNTNRNIAGTAKYSNLLIMPSVGYNWKPFKFPLYIKPWLGLGYTTKVAGTNELGSYSYKISPVVPFPTVHIGYTF